MVASQSDCLRLRFKRPENKHLGSVHDRRGADSRRPRGRSSRAIIRPRRYAPFLTFDSFTYESSGHTARPTDFCWAPGETENWTATSASEDNIVMVWQPTMRVWAGDAVKIDEKELEADAMEGVETTGSSTLDKGKGKTTESGGSSMSVSATSVSGDD